MPEWSCKRDHSGIFFVELTSTKYYVSLLSLSISLCEKLSVLCVEWNRSELFNAKYTERTRSSPSCGG